MGLVRFSGNENYELDVDATLVSQNKATKTSTIYWRLLVVKKNTFGLAIGLNRGNSGWAKSNKAVLIKHKDLSYNFQNGQMAGLFVISEGQFDVVHGINGEAEYSVEGNLTLTNIGTATAGTGMRTLPVISGVPEAPTPLAFGIITSTSIQYRFTTINDGGSPIREREVHYGLDPTGGQADTSSDGDTPITGLLPGRTYYFWSRVRNDNGWGPFSKRSSAKTIFTAKVNVNGDWKNAVPYIKQNGVWKVAIPYIKVNGVWKPVN